MNWIDKLTLAGQHLLPQHGVSRTLGVLAAAEAGSLTQALIKAFIARYNIDMSEALHPDPASYATFNDFFTRELAPHARPIDADSNVAMSPVDGCVSQYGAIHDGRLIQAKNHHFSALELLGGYNDLAQPFHNGSFATLYLSPKDYHRIHMPLDGDLLSMVFVPGDLFSVNPLTAQGVPRLFARNERVVALFNTPKGKMALVLVGATVVASIETVWSGVVAPTNALPWPSRDCVRWDYPASPSLAKGQEMGRFKLGSTVVCLFESQEGANFAQAVTENAPIRLGQPLVQFKES